MITVQPAGDTPGRITVAGRAIGNNKRTNADGLDSSHVVRWPVDRRHLFGRPHRNGESARECCSTNGNRPAQTGSCYSARPSGPASTSS